MVWLLEEFDDDDDGFFATPSSSRDPAPREDVIDQRKVKDDDNGDVEQERSSSPAGVGADTPAPSATLAASAISGLTLPTLGIVAHKNSAGAHGGAHTAL